MTDGKRMVALGLLAATLALGGCNKWVRAGRAHADAQGRLDYVQRTSCATNQQMLNRAVTQLEEKAPGALDGVETGSSEWFRVLDRERVLPMAMPCTGGGKYLRGPAGDVICSRHGASKDIDGTHPDGDARSRRGGTRESSDEDDEPPEVTGEVLALGSWGIGLMFLLAAGYNYTSGGDDVDLLDAMRNTADTPAGQVEPGGYALVEGTVDAEEVLLAPRARTQVVFYRYRQLEEWQQQDKNHIWHTMTRELKVETEVVPFLLRGKGGVVEVAAGGARLEGKRLLRDIVGASGSSTSHGGGGLGVTGKYRNHRYVHEVEGLEVGQPGLVLGPTSAGADGVVRFEKNPEEERPYVVSARDRQGLTQRARDGAGVSTLFMYGFGVLAMIFLAIGFLIPTGTP